MDISTAANASSESYDPSQMSRVIDETQLLGRARKYDPLAVETLLGFYYAPVHRVAYGLSGRDDVGRGVVRFVMNQSIKQIGKWDREGMPERWFSHHTVLTTRRAERYQPETRDDVLVKSVEKPTAEYVAFVKALRSLPQQQREAYLLTQCEGMDIRRVAVAMDCSTEAAGNHLNAAASALRTISGAVYDRMAAQVRDAYAKLAPNEAVTTPSVRKYVRKLVWPRRIKRLFILILLIAIVVAARYAAKWAGVKVP